MTNHPEDDPLSQTPADRESYQAWERNDSLADQAAVELLHALETPINGVPSVEFRNYDNARRLVKAALLAVFEAKL